MYDEKIQRLLADAKKDEAKAKESEAEEKLSALKGLSFGSLLAKAEKQADKEGTEEVAKPVVVKS